VIDIERWYNIGIKTASGWIFALVEDFDDYSPIELNRFETMSAQTSTVTYGGTSGVWHQIKNTDDEDVFWEEEKDYVRAAVIGVWPPSLRVFVQYPAPVPRKGIGDIRVDAAPDAETPGWFNGMSDTPYGSPFYGPTDASFMLIPKETLIKLGFYNPEPFSVNPELNVVIKRLKVRYYNIDDDNDRRIISAIVNGKIPCKRWSPGTYPFNYPVEDKLGVPPVQIGGTK